MMRTFNFKFTEQCNMQCPWCLAQFSRDGRTPVKLWDSTTYDCCINAIRSGEYDRIAIAGGEPLLYPDILKDLVLSIRQYDKTIPVVIFSNGSLLSHELSSFFQTHDVYLTISISPYDYKTIENLIKCSPYEDIIDIIRNTRNVCIRYVYTGNVPYSKAIMNIRETFNSTIDVSPDYTALDKIDDEYIQQLKNEFKTVENTYPDHKNWLSWTLSATQYCDCAYQATALCADGQWRKIPFYSPKIIYGCSGFFDKVPAPLYNRFIVAVSNHTKTNKHRGELCRI